MQVRYDGVQAKLKIAPTDTKSYVPPFLSIKANDIEDWVSHNIPRGAGLPFSCERWCTRLAADLRKLTFPAMTMRSVPVGTAS